VLLLRRFFALELPAAAAGAGIVSTHIRVLHRFVSSALVRNILLLLPFRRISEGKPPKSAWQASSGFKRSR
jgi:hypothetical protein